MSEKDVEIARSFTDAFNAHDVEALIACCHPDVEFHSTFTVLHGRGKQSGAEAVLPVAAVSRSRDGRLVYYKAYIHREDALRDLGVSGDALEPIPP